jgi:hypothetical protein
MRRDFELLPPDNDFLNDYGLAWETILDGCQWVVVHNFPTHEGYNHQKVSVGIRLETGYPNTALDMAYFYPPLSRNDGKPIVATEATQLLDGKQFQRWSRHRSGQNPWLVGFDNLGTHIFLVEDWLQREFERCPQS